MYNLKQETLETVQFEPKKVRTKQKKMSQMLLMWTRNKTL